MHLSQGTLYNDDILNCVEQLKIPHFIPKYQAMAKEYRILNLNTHLQDGSHWTCRYKRGKDRYYSDSFGEPPPIELLQYLKTYTEWRKDLPAIKCNAVTVQHDQSNECGSLCLYVLKEMSRGLAFSTIIEHLERRYNRLTSPDLVI